MSKSSSINIVQIDDEVIYHDKIASFLRRQNSVKCNLMSFISFDEMITRKRILKSAHIFIVDFDLKSKKNGADVIKYLKKHYPNTPSILITAYSKTEIITATMKAGAVDFLWKTEMTADFLISIITKYSKKLHAQHRNIKVDDLSFPIIGKTAIDHLSKTLALLDAGPAIKLFEGEPGVGKTYLYGGLKSYLERHYMNNVALYYWDCSDPDIKVDTAFQFTNESNNSSSHAKTQNWIFFDNVHNLSGDQQAKLYEHLSDHFVVYRKYNIKAICTSTHPLYSQAKKGHFNTNLASLLSLYHEKIEPYRERKREENTKIIKYLLKLVSSPTVKELSAPALEILLDAKFQLQNIAELKKILTHITDSSSTPYLSVGLIPKYLLPEEKKNQAIVGPKILITDKTLLLSDWDTICNHVLAAVLPEKLLTLSSVDRTISRLARELGLNRKTFIKKLGLLIDQKFLDPKFDLREKKGT